MATQYNITIQDLLTPPRISGGTLTLPSADEVVYAPTGATIIWNDPLADYRNSLIVLGANARYEQFRLNTGEFVVWSPDSSAGPMNITIRESDIWNGAIRSRTAKYVIQMPSYRYSPIGDNLRLILLRADCWINAAGTREC